ncbi:hypothetical protein PENSOL_c077G05338 [Penicillium solitum]|uniref:Calcineurin-like phosphoesterase domain-containing protein n=1 Tax=Penicillium solitum TaxID=60172 RepID=A0A1V6QEN4_9EURO|nr:uncharacterized protein PENSOL_c077G05338 [Penicillium solitum]OQD87447.1 hypothetical protein PENSOL_c077G05338 [Penicillium solitum]
MRSFEASMNKKTSLGKFVFLDQTRYDVTKDLTVLGCTLFSQVSSQQEFAVECRMVDFKDILRWNVDGHNAAHTSDVEWLNAQVSTISKTEPLRRIAIFTHHSPSVDSRCTDPKHIGSDVSTGFATDLSHEECWTNPAVVAWGFGHTHFNCAFTDADGKAVVSNQKGYRLIPVKDFNPERAFSIGERGGKKALAERVVRDCLCIGKLTDVTGDPAFPCTSPEPDSPVE